MLFRFTSSNCLLPQTSICVIMRFTLPFLATNCNVNQVITVNSYNFLKFLVKNILLCSMSNMKFDLCRFDLRHFILQPTAIYFKGLLYIHHLFNSFFSTCFFNFNFWFSYSIFNI